MPPGRSSLVGSITSLLLIAAPVVYLTKHEYSRLATEVRVFPAEYERFDLKPERTNYGVVVLVPEDGDRVGDSSIPSAPESRFQPNLEFRGQSLKDGFRIDGPPRL
jgi:hypothetical protein